MRLLLFGIIFLFQSVGCSLFAQSGKIDSDSKGLPVIQSINIVDADSTKGLITIQQDPRILGLVQKHVKSSELANGIEGWRIQIYNSSGRVARDEANDERTRFLNKYPDLKAYLIYQPPYFKIRVGDYRSKQEAYKMYKQIVKQFPVSYLVPDKINLPDLNLY